MAGEMARIDQNGNDSNGDTWHLHAAIAKEFGGTLHPFDVYQGPYIRVGSHKLWLTPAEEWPAYRACVYDESTDRVSDPFDVYEPDAEAMACESARELLQA